MFTKGSDDKIVNREVVNTEFTTANSPIPLMLLIVSIEIVTAMPAHCSLGLVISVT